MKVIVGQDVFSKNDSEIYGKVTAVGSHSATVVMWDDEDKIEQNVPLCSFTNWTGVEWDFPNWFFN